jgi:5-methylcytosine-specific restriction endonuclease McrA
MPANTCLGCGRNTRQRLTDGRCGECARKAGRAHSQRANSRYSNPAYRGARKMALVRDGHRCRWLVRGRRCEATAGLTAHHIVPIHFGGKHTVDNLVTLCGAHHEQAEREFEVMMHKAKHHDP